MLLDSNKDLPSTRATPSLVDAEDGAAAAKAVIVAAKIHSLEPQQRQCASAHDAGLTGNVEFTPTAASITVAMRQRAVVQSYKAARFASSCLLAAGHTL